MLSPAAFNAFLKTLEEPPAHVIFILATTEKHKILPTILSRCQIYDFERMSVPGIIDHLKKVAEKEGIVYEEAALNVIATKADGGMRDALSIFDQAASFSQGNITYQKVIEDLNVLDADNYFNIVDLSLENKVPEIMVLLNNVINKGFDGGNLINGLASHVRDVLMAKDAQTLSLLATSNEQRQRYQQQAAKCPTQFLYKALEIMNRCDVEYRQSSNKRLLVELTLIQVAQITQKEDDSPASGRSPKQLKTLFRNIILTAQPQTASQVAGASRKHNAHEKEQDSAATHVTVATKNPLVSAQSPVSAMPKVRLGSLGMSFAQLMNEGKKEEKHEEDVEITNKDEHQSFTWQELIVEWKGMCNRIAKINVSLAQRMKLIKPQILPDGNIEVVVGNKILLDEMQTIRGRIRATMAQRLHNGQIDVMLRLAKAEELKPILTPRQELEKMQQQNPSIAKLIEQLGLQLE